MDEFLRLKNTQEDTIVLTAGPEAVYEELEESSNNGGPNLNYDDTANNYNAECVMIFCGMHILYAFGIM